ncbi:MAG TPA: helix-turn-helix domain-containing protein [Streptosporangiaceae bacterium]|jgi:AcrR family transcriptional regulator
MARDVNPLAAARRGRRVADTESRLLQAASRLFIRDGYSATTLAAVAEAAGVAPRTVYVRFGTKAALLKRAVDVALVGDTSPVDVAGREWMQRSMTAPTLDERIAAGARGARDMMHRVGPLLAVAAQAEPVEPVIAAAAQAGREATRDSLRRFWTTAAADGLLGPGADVDWLAQTAALVGAAQTYLLAARTLGWDPDAYERWLILTWHRLAAAAASTRTDPPPA